MVDLNFIHPSLRAAITSAHTHTTTRNRNFVITSGLRTWTEQDELYTLGRTVSGNIVTNARGGESLHNYGLACDFALEEDGKLTWPDPVISDVWSVLEEGVHHAAQDPKVPHDVDYEWGGRWHFRDAPHVQIRATLNELRAGYYPPSSDVDWLVKAHTTFLFNTPWICRRAQKLLNDLGLEAGSVDGAWGSRSRNAVIAFQSSRKLPVTGQPNEATMRLLVLNTQS